MSPYQIEKLEFPNTTWAGQDLRKVGIFYMANYYSPIKKEGFVEKAVYFHQHIVKTLGNDSSNQYTRILALLMQTLAFRIFIKILLAKMNLKKLENTITQLRKIRYLKLFHY